MVRALVVDLDDADHEGLADTPLAARCLASAADSWGLFDGVLLVKSRRAIGRHFWLLPPAPMPLADAVAALAALLAKAYQLACDDVTEWRGPHAFRTVAGPIAKPGESGKVEVRPHSTTRPEFGWPTLLPFSGAALRSHGGGVAVDAYTGEPYELTVVPRCDARQWGRFIAEARAAVPKPKPKPRPAQRRTGGDLLRRVTAKTLAFLEGKVAEGGRNIAALAATCNLLAIGATETEAEGLILQGAAGCGLPEHEARAAVASAIGTRRGQA